MGARLLAVGLCNVELTAQRVWVVAPTAGQGVDFTDVQPAVDAAVNGDIVLVRPGTYTLFRISGKGLTVVADGGAQLVPGGSFTLLINSGPGQPTLIRGFAATSDGTPLSITAGAPVTVQDCTFTQSMVSSPLFGPSSASGSSAISFLNCRITGGVGMRGALDGLSIGR